MKSVTLQAGLWQTEVLSKNTCGVRSVNCGFFVPVICGRNPSLRRDIPGNKIAFGQIPGAVSCIPRVIPATLNGVVYSNSKIHGGHNHA